MHAKRANAEYKIRGRLAHPGHISKTGTSWKANERPACILSWKRDANNKQYFEATGEVVKLNVGPVKCKTCDEVIRYDSRGYAFCQCQIHNDSITKSISDIAKQVRSDVLQRKTKRFARSLVSL